MPLMSYVRAHHCEVTEDLIKRFDLHARTSPDELAIITKTTCWTYRTLHNDVMRWCDVLNGLNINKPVILCLHRTPSLISILLALQWLGIPYIPVDSSTPLARIADMISECDADLFLYDVTASSKYNVLPIRIVNIHHFSEDYFVKAVHIPFPENNKTAYILYTSGTTGKPKGVIIGRLALNNFLMSMSQYFLKKDKELLLAITTLTFDIAGLELYLPLWQGKTLYLADENEYKNPLAIIDILEKYPVTCLQATPGFWQLLVSVGLNYHPIVALCGGEPLRQALASDLLTKVSSLFNMFGPTEATIWCSIKEITSADNITVGKPINNVEMVVMDEQHTVLPSGFKGQLYIGGLALADGYTNHALTDEKFLWIDGRRLYYVGDIASMDDNLCVHIHGREDHQVKLHGYRIELEEIEARLLTHRCILQCAVLLHKEQLIAYVRKIIDNPITDREIFIELAEYLPAYMIPSRIVSIETMPITSNGKIDRHALLSLHKNPVIKKTSTPLSKTESLLHDIWVDTFHLSEIDIEDNFYELGGHSLRALRICAMLEKEIHKTIAPNHIYQSVTIKNLAVLVDSLPINDKVVSEISLPSPAYGTKIQLSDFQLLLWLGKVFGSDVKQLNIVGRRRLSGSINKEALDMALQSIFEEQEVLSYTVPAFYPCQSIHKKSPVYWCEQDLQDNNEDTIESYLRDSLEELKRYRAWTSSAPMILPRLFYLPNDAIELQISIPHLLADARSLDIFFQRLSEIYLHSTQKSLKSYASYIHNEHTLYKKSLESDVEFWKEYLAEASLLTLPKECVTQDNKQRTPTCFEISEEALTCLQVSSAEQHIMFHDILCAAIITTLSRYCPKKQQHLFVNTVKSTRDNPAYDDVMGCFLRLQPIKVEIGENKTLVESALEIQHSSQETSNHQHAAALVKLAAIGKLPCHKHSVKGWFLKKLKSQAQHISVDTSIIAACERLSRINDDHGYLVNINMFDCFFNTPQSSQKTLLGCPLQPMPVGEEEYVAEKDVLDFTFFREPCNFNPYLAISGNITKDFCNALGADILERINRAQG